MATHCVYWLFDNSCNNDPTLHGYIGCTKNLSSRITAHRSSGAFPEGFEHRVLFEGGQRACLRFEHRLRPVLAVGWNKRRGGQRPGSRPPWTPERRAAMSARFKDKPKSAAQRAKMSAAASGENNPFFGRKHSKKTRKLYSAQRRGNQHALGVRHTDEQKAKWSLDRKGNQNWRHRDPARFL